MLRIIQNQNASSAASYYSQSDYYSEGQELVGQWGGQAAQLLGLVGEVDQPSFQRMCENHLRQQLSIAEGQLVDYQARLGQVFSQADYLSQLTDLRDQLKAGLSSNAPATTEGPSVAELATCIQSLKATQAGQETPVRDRPAPTLAEQPVTARIRQRLAGQAGTEAEMVTPELPEGEPPHLMLGSFQERRLAERHHRETVHTPA